MSRVARDGSSVGRRNPGLHAKKERTGGMVQSAVAGQPFDPTLHEAVATVQDAAGAAGTVVDEAGRGYLWNDELLRPARVRVAG